MQTLTPAPLGTESVLQFEAAFQLPEAPPVQMAAPEALQAVELVSVKLAITLVAAFIVTAQLPVPEQAPDQPANVEPALGVAVSVTTVPASNLAEQVGWQVIAAGLLETEPRPGPASATARTLPLVTTVEELEELLAVLGSGVVEVTLAVLTSVPAWVRLTTIVMFALWPLVIVPRVQVTVVVPVHEPSDVAEETKATPTGNASVMATLAALIGPLLVTVIE